MFRMKPLDRLLRSNLKLKHLQLLVALDQFRHLGRAAEFLALTQPAVSKTLAEVERQFGVGLFVRSTRGTEPTAQGHSLVRFARRVLVDLERTQQALAEGGEVAAGHVSVGAMMVALSTWACAASGAKAAAASARVSAIRRVVRRVVTLVSSGLS